MTKSEFITERTRIISEMLDNPDKHGIYPTSRCFEQLDTLFDDLVAKNTELRKKVIKECYDQFIYCVDDDEYVKWMNKELNTQEK